MSVASSQQQTFLRLLAELRPHWRRDAALPGRIQALFGRNKSFGSRDRRLYRELIYTALRYLPWIEPLLDSDPSRAAKIVAWLAAESRATASYRTALAGDWPPLASLRERAEFLDADSTALLPSWFRSECPSVFEPAELETQLARAPLWLRLQTDDANAVAAELTQLGWQWRESDVLPSAWQVLEEADVTKSDAYARGAIEIQDLGSQLLLETIGLERGARWLDACAGAGGKTLQLARLVGTTGSVDAHDIRPAALEELTTRAARASIRQIRTVATPVVGGYDGVLVDAPCSGSGTWRRSPHLKWITTPALVAERAALQRTLLNEFAACVRPGGRLVYATCSLARSENDAVIEAFLATHPDFEIVPFARTFGFEPQKWGLTILPSRPNTDGFFVAPMRRRAV